MPTAKPRIQVTVTESQYQLLKRLAQLQDRSMSAVLSELFDQIEPVYERVAVVLQAALRAQDSMKQGLIAATESAEAELAPMLAQAMGQLDMLVHATEVPPPLPAEASAASPAGSEATPGPVTRGSASPHTPPKAAHIRPTSPRRASRRPGRKSPSKSVRKQVAAAIAAAVKRGPVKATRRRK